MADLDRFQGIFAVWGPVGPPVELDSDNPDSLKHILADAWLVEADLKRLDARAAENNGETSAISAEFLE